MTILDFFRSIKKRIENRRLEKQIIKLKISYAQYKKELFAIQGGIKEATAELYRVKKEAQELTEIAKKAQKAQNTDDAVRALQRVEVNEGIISEKEAFISKARKSFDEVFAQMDVLGNQIGDIQNKNKEIETRERINELNRSIKDDLSSITATYQASLEESEARLNAIDEVRKMSIFRGGRID